MTASRVWVVPQWTRVDARAAVIAAALLGFLAGAATGAPNRASVVESAGPLLGLYFAWPLVYALASIATTHRKWPLFRVGASFWAAQVLAFAILSGLVGEDRGASLLTWNALWPMPVAALILGALGGGMHLGVRWITRAFVFELREQDGQTCWRCGYQMGSHTITLCPECGTPLDTAHARLSTVRRAAAWLHKGSIPLAVILLLLGVLATIPTLVTRTIPNARFLWAFRAGELAPGTDGVGRFVPVPLGTADQLLLTYTPSDTWRVPAMTAQAGVIHVGANGESSFDPGAPWIRWDFTRQQAEYVVRYGLPAEFLEQVRRTLADEHWQPGLRSRCSPKPAGPSVPENRR